MGLVIKRRVSLDFLGDDYKEAYINFRAIPTKDFPPLTEKINKLDETDNTKSTEFILQILNDYFLDGKDQEGNDLAKEDLGVLDPPSVIRCFEGLTGAIVGEEGTIVDPKDTAQSEKPSSTEASTTK